MADEITPASGEDVERLKGLAREVVADPAPGCTRAGIALDMACKPNIATTILSLIAWGEAAERERDEARKYHEQTAADYHAMLLAHAATESRAAQAEAQVREMAGALSSIKACERYLYESIGAAEPAGFLRAGLEDATDIAAKALSTSTAAVALAEREVVEAAHTYWRNGIPHSETEKARAAFARFSEAVLNLAELRFDARAKAEGAAPGIGGCDEPGCDGLVGSNPNIRWNVTRTHGRCEVCGKWTQGKGLDKTKKQPTQDFSPCDNPDHPRGCMHEAAPADTAGKHGFPDTAELHLFVPGPAPSFCYRAEIGGDGRICGCTRNHPVHGGE